STRLAPPICSGLATFSATTRRRAGSNASYTRPKAPSPTYRRTSNRPTRGSVAAVAGDGAGGGEASGGTEIVPFPAGPGGSSGVVVVERGRRQGGQAAGASGRGVVAGDGTSGNTVMVPPPACSAPMGRRQCGQMADTSRRGAGEADTRQTPLRRGTPRS